MLKNYEMNTLLRGLPVYLVFEMFVRSPGFALMKRDPRLLLIPLASVVWNIRRMGDLWRARRQVQQSRGVPDANILRAMGPSGIAPLSHLLRRARRAKFQMSRSPTSALASSDVDSGSSSAGEK